MAHSRAELFFQEIVEAEDPAAFLQVMADPASQTFEEEWRDFKYGHGIDAKTKTPIPLDSRTIKRLWSESLSAFANTGGGVLVWGIDCRSIPSPANPTKNIDVANGVKLVIDPAALKSELMRLHHMATDPGVTGVEIKTVPIANIGGFVVCLIPESAHKPHTAEYAEGKPYLMRVGDDNVSMPRSILRSMFFPHSNPRLKITAITTCPNRPMVDYKITITNVGAATVRDLLVVVKIIHEYTNSEYFFIEGGWSSVPNPNGTGILCCIPLHPGQTSSMISSCFRHRDGIFAQLRFNFEIYGLDCERHVASLEFSLNDAANGAEKSIIACPE